MTISFAPPFVDSPNDLLPSLKKRGFAVLTASQFRELAALEASSLANWASSWDELPLDNYLRDGGRYRRRRFSSFVVRDDVVQLVAHRPHWQPYEYNALHGGMERHFEPIDPVSLGSPSWDRLLRWLGQVASELRGKQPWYVEAHQFRIDTTDGIGRPTPEGAHRDGVDLVAVFLIGRSGIKGGETRVFDNAGPSGQRFTLVEPWSVLLLDDLRVIHESTPIQPLTNGGQRDTLVVTLRARSFQSP